LQLQRQDLLFSSLFLFETNETTSNFATIVMCLMPSHPSHMQSYVSLELSLKGHLIWNKSSNKSLVWLTKHTIPTLQITNDNNPQMHMKNDTKMSLTNFQNKKIQSNM
jgi:hypothetical protein